MVFTGSASQMMTAAIGATVLAFLALMFGDWVGDLIRFRFWK